MKNLKLMFASLLLMAGSITNSVSASTPVNIPSSDVIDLNSADIEMVSGHTKAKVTGDPARFDNFYHGDKAVFTLNNSEDQRFVISFEASTGATGNQVQLTIMDANNNIELNKFVDVTKGTSGWSSFDTYSITTGTITKGSKTMRITFWNKDDNENGTTVNLQNLKIEAYDPATDPSLGQIIPGSIDLTKGTFNTNEAGKKGKTKDVTAGDNTFTTLDSFYDGCSVSYDINATEASAYKLTFAAACNLSGVDVKLNFTITDKESGAVEADVDQPVTKNGKWDDFSTTYSVDIPQLTKGAKTLLITFYSAEGKFTTNVADIKFESTGASGISGISASDVSKDGAYYSLSGVRVVSPSKGHVYIKDGKKVLVK